jgi:hypothetical protein
VSDLSQVTANAITATQDWRAHASQVPLHIFMIDSAATSAGLLATQRQLHNSGHHPRMVPGHHALQCGVDFTCCGLSPSTTLDTLLSADVRSQHIATIADKQPQHHTQQKAPTLQHAHNC